METTLKVLLTRMDKGIPRVMLSTLALQEHKDTKTCTCLVSFTCATCVAHIILHYVKNSVALVRERTIPTERPPPVGEVSANFCG